MFRRRKWPALRFPALINLPATVIRHRAGGSRPWDAEHPARSHQSSVGEMTLASWRCGRPGRTRPGTVRQADRQVKMAYCSAPGRWSLPMVRRRRPPPSTLFPPFCSRPTCAPPYFFRRHSLSPHLRRDVCCSHAIRSLIVMRHLRRRRRSDCKCA